MKVSEIFTSIEGEGIRAGYPAIFIRLFGCNIRCTYCDSQYACIGNDYKEMTVQDVVNAVHEFDDQYHISRVTLTGGEPLLQEPEVYELIEVLTTQDYEINIETNGAVSIQNVMTTGDPKNIIVTMDWKSVSSGMSEFMLVDNLQYLRKQDVLKFVVGTNEDLDQMLSVLNRFPDLPCSIFVSPVFGQISPATIVEYMLSHKLSDVRIQIQIHKYIWDPNMRGV